jgi:hypothetical protein
MVVYVLLACMGSLFVEEHVDQLWRVPSRCGVNIAYAMLKFHGKRVDYASVLEIAGLDGDRGSSLGSLAYCLNRFGLDVRVVKSDSHGIEYCRLPLVAHLETANLQDVGVATHGHYVLIYGLGDEVNFVDGTSGMLQTMSKEKFMNAWSGYLIVRSSGWQFNMFTIGALVGFLSSLILGLKLVIKNYRKLRISVCVFLLVYVFFAEVGLAQEQKISNADFGRIVGGVLDNHAKVHSAVMSIRTTQASDLDVRELFEKHAISKLLVLSSVEFAFSGEKRFLKESIHRKSLTGQAKKRKGVRVTMDESGKVVRTPIEKPIEDETISEVSYYFNEKELIKTGKNSADIIKADFLESMPLGYFFTAYPSMIGWYIPDPTSSDERREFMRKMHFFQAVEVANRSLRVWSEAETGNVCVREIVSSGENIGNIQKTWLDPRLGYMITRKTMQTSDEQLMIVSADYSVPFEVEKGFWIGSHVDIKEYSKIPESNSVVVLKTSVDCKIRDINSVPDTIFEATVRPGSLVLEWQEPLQKTGSTKARSYIAAANGRDIDGMPRFTVSRTWYAFAVLLMTSFLLIIGVVWLLWKRK